MSEIRVNNVIADNGLDAVNFAKGINVSSGIITATSFSGSGDTNTKIRFPAADTITAETGGLERLRINSNGSLQVTPEGSTSNPYMLIDTSGDSVRFNAQKASGNNEFRFLTQSSGTVTERLRIDSNGNITKPTNFHILVQRSGNQTGYNASSTSTPIIWNSVVTGSSSSGASSHFNTSTGLFTAPVTGLYFFHIAVNCNFSVEQAWLIINGSRANYSAINPNSAATSDQSLAFYVTAGQTVGTQWYDNGNTNATINANVLHTWWRIILLG